jgi:hypothetical protein
LLKHLPSLSLAARKVFASAINEVAGAHWQKSERNQRAHTSLAMRDCLHHSAYLNWGLDRVFFPFALIDRCEISNGRGALQLFDKFWVNRYFKNSKADCSRSFNI